MPVTASDLISSSEVSAVLDERTRAMYQFRRAYRNDDATDLNSNKKTFPRAVDTLEGDMGDVAEEADYPRSELEYEGIDAEYTKDGFEVAISDEAADDSVIQTILDITEEMGVAAESRLDSRAYTGLANNNNDTVIGTAGTSLDFQAIVNAYTTLASERRNPSNFEIYAGPNGWGDLATNDTFNRATDQGDALAREGLLARVFGTPIALTNTGDLDPTEAFMVDRSSYGYESTRWEREVTQYREESKDRDVFKIRHRKDFVVMRPEAAIRIAGGTA